MANIDTPIEMKAWFSEHEAGWVTRGITARLILPGPNQVNLNKAVTTLETSTLAASLTAWGTGTVEFIVLDLPTSSEIVMNDKEYTTVDELRELFDECASLFDEQSKE